MPHFLPSSGFCDIFVLNVHYSTEENMMSLREFFRGKTAGI
jgi:hypothetical protein